MRPGRWACPFAGLFGACSTMAEALGVGACLCSAGMADGLLAMTSSHFCTAERQFRTPLSYGAVRTPTAQWTATAAGACLLRPAGQGVGIRAVTFGRVQDLGIRDINNMGAAMAPAAAATLLRYLTDTNTQPQEFDAICTGDLGHVGSQLFRELLAAEGLLLKNHVDCGSLLYDAEGQSVHSGASGPGCCAAVLCGHLLPRLERRGAAPGSLSGNRRADEPDHLFAEGEHPRHLAPGGACCPGGTERREHMNYFWAFVTGGAICVVGQLFLDLTALTPRPHPDGLCGGGRGAFGPWVVFAAGRVCRLRCHRSPCWASGICLPKACAPPLPKREPSASRPAD